MQRFRSRCFLGYACLLLVSWMVGPRVAMAQPLARAQVRAHVEASLPAFEALAQRTVDAGGVPGLAIAVVVDDETVFLKGFGRKQVGLPEPVDADTVFQIASLSKPVSSTVIAALVSEGVAGWNSRIADLDPAFRLHDPYPASQVTVQDLLNHRSGLPGSGGDDLEDIGYGRDEILHRLRLVQPSSSFRAGYSYSNFGFTEGAVAAAKPTGKPWEVVARDRLFRPLGMTSTSTTHDDFLARANRATLHVKADGVWVARARRDPDAQAPAGGISSTVRDLAQWLRLEIGNGMVDKKQIIAASALDETHVPLTARGNNPVTGAASFYGLGWNAEYGRHGLSWGHAGAFSVGAQTLVTIYPKSGLGIVLLTNGFPSGVPEGLADSFADLVFDGRIGQDWLTDWGRIYEGMFAPSLAANRAAYAAPPAGATASLALPAYTGRYANAYVGQAVVSEADGSLTLTIGPGGARTYPMRHFDRDLFLCFPDAETPDRPSSIRFTVGSDGKATAMTVESLNANGLGTLERSKD